MSRTANSIKIVISSFLCQVIIMICGFILPPMLIEQYGSEINGLLALVKQLMVYFSVVCLGLGVSAQVALYKPIGDSDWNSINAILTATKSFYRKSGGYFAVFTIICSGLLPFLIKSDISHIETCLIVLITGIGGLCEYVIISKYRIFLVANQQQYVNSRITAEGILLNTIVSVILIKFNANVVFVQLGSTIIYVIRLWQTTVHVKRKYPKISFNSSTPAYDRLKNRWTAFSYELSGMIIQLSPAIIVAIVCNLTDVSIFSVYFMVFNALAMISAIFSSGIQAPFGDIIANDDETILKKAFGIFQFAYTLILSICFACASMLLTSFVGAYIHNDDGVEYKMPVFALLMSVYFFMRYMRIPFTTLVNAKGLFKINNAHNIIEAISFILLAFIFTRYMGLYGIPIAGIITAIPRSILYMNNCRENFNSLINLKRYGLKLFVTLTLVIVSFFTIKINESSNLWKWMIESIPYVLTITLSLSIIHILFDWNSFISLLKRLRLIK